MNLLTWILSLLIEWGRPLHPADPVLAPVRTSTPGDFQGPAIRPGVAPGDSADPETVRRQRQAALDPDRLLDEDLERDLAAARGGAASLDEELGRDAASELDWKPRAGAGGVGDIDDGRQGAAGGVAGTIRPGSGLSAANPLWPLGERLIRLLVPRGSRLGWGNWAALILLPVSLAWGGELLLETLGLAGDLVWLLISAGIVYLTVPLGRLWRRLDRLSLLAGAGELTAFRQAIANWNADDLRPGAGGSSGHDPDAIDLATAGAGAGAGAGASGASASLASASLASASDASASDASASDASLADRGATEAARLAGPSFDRASFVLPLIDAYRDVFAPLFWLVLLGPAGPLGYAMARLLAERGGGVGCRALYWIDWLPLRLASASFAFSGHFDDAMLGLRCALEAARFERVETRVDRDPVLVQELIILPTAAGAMGIQLSGPAVEARLAQAAVDHEEPEIKPSATNFMVLRSLLGRTAMMWAGLWVLLTLVS